MTNSKIKSIKSIINNVNHPQIEAEDIAFGLLEFENGSLANIEATTNIYPKNLEESLFISGEKGIAKLTGKSLSHIEIWDTISHPQVLNPHDFFNFKPIDISNLHIPVFYDFYQSVSNKILPAVTIDDAIVSLEIILGMYQSALTDKTIYFPLENISSLDFEGKFKW